MDKEVGKNGTGRKLVKGRKRPGRRTGCKLREGRAAKRPPGTLGHAERYVESGSPIIPVSKRKTAKSMPFNSA